MGAFRSTKYSGLKFRVFHATDGTVFSSSLDYPIPGHQGRFPFGQKFRKFRFGAKWKTFFRFARLENSQKKWNCSQCTGTGTGTGTAPNGNLCSIYRISRLYHQFHAFRGLLSGQASLGSLVFPKNGGFWKLFANKLQGYYECSACQVLAPDHGNLLQHECVLYKSGR